MPTASLATSFQACAEILVNLALLVGGHLRSETQRLIQDRLRRHAGSEAEDFPLSGMIDAFRDSIRFDRKRHLLSTNQQFYTLNFDDLCFVMQVAHEILTENPQRRPGAKHLLDAIVDSPQRHNSLKTTLSGCQSLTAYLQAREHHHQALEQLGFHHQWLSSRPHAISDHLGFDPTLLTHHYLLGLAVTADGTTAGNEYFTRNIETTLPGLDAVERERIGRGLRKCCTSEPWQAAIALEDLEWTISDPTLQITFTSLIELARISPSERLREFILDLQLISGRGIRELSRMLLLAQAPDDLLPSALQLHPLGEGPRQLTVTPRGLDDTTPAANGIPLSLQRQPSGDWSLHTADGAHEFVAGKPFWIGDWELLLLPEKNTLALYPVGPPEFSAHQLQQNVGSRQLLDNISFSCSVGQIVALCGSSGCGKTTLLSLLSGLNDGWSGEIFYGTRKILNNSDLREICTYIPQDDILYRQLRVEESIHCSAQLTWRARSDSIKKRVNELLHWTGLAESCRLIIGDENRKGISGGQRKRLHIANSIVGGMKSVLFFDEPFAALDPSTSIEILHLLRNIARKGHLVFVVTHNLHEGLLRQFDRVIILGREGMPVYSGQPEAISSFFGLRDEHEIFDRLDSIPKESLKEHYDKSVGKLRDEHAVREHRDRVHARHLDQHHEKLRFRRDPGWWSRLSVFLKRDLLCKSRDKQYLLACLIQPLLMAGIIVWNFSGPVPNAQFTLVVTALWIGAIAGVREINGEWAQIRSDLLAGCPASSFLCAKSLSTCLFSAVQVLLLTATVAFSQQYLTTPFDLDASRWFGGMLLLSFFGLSMGLCLSALLNSTLTSLAALPVILIPMLVMSGFLYRHSDARPLQSRITWFNPVRAIFENSIYAFDTALLPSAMGARRSTEQAQRQHKRHAAYLEQLRLYEENPEHYAITSGLDGDRLLNAILEGSSNLDTRLAIPTTPPDAEDHALLVHHPDRWLHGDRLVQVDHGLKPWEPYEIHRPRNFSTQLSLQGLYGMYFEKDQDRALSCYRPAEYLWLPLVWTLLLLGCSLGLMRHRLGKGL